LDAQSFKRRCLPDEPYDEISAAIINRNYMGRLRRHKGTQAPPPIQAVAHFDWDIGHDRPQSRASPLSLGPATSARTPARRNGCRDIRALVFRPDALPCDESGRSRRRPAGRCCRQLHGEAKSAMIEETPEAVSLRRAPGMHRTR